MLNVLCKIDLVVENLLDFLDIGYGRFDARLGHFMIMKDPPSQVALVSFAHLIEALHRHA